MKNKSPTEKVRVFEFSNFDLHASDFFFHEKSFIPIIMPDSFYCYQE